MTRRPSPSMIVALIALVMSLGGSAYAAHQLLISGRQIKRGTVTGDRLKNDTLTGKQIKESRLGRVPRAALADRATTLGGLGVGAFVQGGGRTFAASKTLPTGTTTSTPAFVVPGVGTAQMTCDASGKTNIQLANGTGATADESVAQISQGSPISTDGLAVPPNFVVVGATTSRSGQVHVLLLWPTGSTGHALELSIGWYQPTGSSCTAIAEGVVR
jgi:hypothetical protein